MNNLGVNFADDLGQVIADMPNTLIIGASRYSVAADDERRSVDISEEAGYAVYDRTVTGVLSRFRAVPAVQSTCTLDAIKYCIADVSRNTETDTLTLTLRRDDAQP